jgi:AbrB family looped-hinge helix DNA binding protein
MAYLCKYSKPFDASGDTMKPEIAVVTSKGQLVIPARLRRHYGIRKGTQIAFLEDGDRLLMQPLTPEFIRGLRGSLTIDASSSKKPVDPLREKTE